MSRLLASVLALACLSFQTPALADVTGNREVTPPGVPGGPNAAPATSGAEPKLTIIPVPLPLLMVGAIGSYENFRIGTTRNSVNLLAGYIWGHDPVFDPLTTAAVPPQGLSSNYAESNRWRLTAAWDVQIWDGWTLGPALRLEAGGVPAVGTYDPNLVGGTSFTIGPALHYRGLDEKAWPTRGNALDLVYGYGEHFGGDTFGFHKGGINAMHYFPVAHNQTVALRGAVFAGTPQLAWLDKFDAGGGDFVRGYAWDRFTGDRLAAVGLEYRNLFLEDALGLAGWHQAPLNVGLAGTLHLDAGRAWEARPGIGLPVGSDPRVGGGVGVILTLERAPLGRVELNVGSEGLVLPIAQLGTSF